MQDRLLAIIYINVESKKQIEYYETKPKRKPEICPHIHTHAHALTRIPLRESIAQYHSKPKLNKNS